MGNSITYNHSINKTQTCYHPLQWEIHNFITRPRISHYHASLGPEITFWRKQIPKCAYDKRAWKLISGTALRMSAILKQFGCHSTFSKISEHRKYHLCQILLAYKASWLGLALRLIYFNKKKMIKCCFM